MQSQFRFDNECYLNLPENHKRVSETSTVDKTTENTNTNMITTPKNVIAEPTTPTTTTNAPTASALSTAQSAATNEFETENNGLHNIAGRFLFLFYILLFWLFIFNYIFFISLFRILKRPLAQIPCKFCVGCQQHL